jgi:hypothetical protein
MKTQPRKEMLCGNAISKASDLPVVPQAVTRTPESFGEFR